MHADVDESPISEMCTNVHDKYPLLVNATDGEVNRSKELLLKIEIFIAKRSLFFMFVSDPILNK